MLVALHSGYADISEEGVAFYIDIWYNSNTKKLKKSRLDTQINKEERVREAKALLPIINCVDVVDWDSKTLKEAIKSISIQLKEKDLVSLLWKGKLCYIGFNNKEYCGNIQLVEVGVKDFIINRVFDDPTNVEEYLVLY